MIFALHQFFVRFRLNQSVSGHEELINYNGVVNIII